MAMQVEHKTEKGTVLFYLPPIGADRFKFFNDEEPYLSYFIGSETFRKRFQRGTVLIGLTSEITEEMAKMMLPTEKERHPYLKLYVNYTEESTRYAYLLKKALLSFKSLMQYLKVYESNPFNTANYPKSASSENDYVDARYEQHQYDKAQENVGKWVVLFKSN